MRLLPTNWPFAFRIGVFLLLSFSAFHATNAQPTPCGPNPDMTSYCADACVICNIDGYTGINSDTEQGEAPPGFCTGTIHHMQWIAFIAGSTNLTITVTPSNCNSGYGLEVGIYESPDCQNYNLVSNCDGDVTQGETGVFTNIVPLVIGQHYYFVMDGNHGDVCNYTIHVTQGSTQVPPLAPTGGITGVTETCLSSIETYTVPINEGATFYQWTLDGAIVGNGLSQEINWNTPGLHQLCVSAYNVCDTATPSCMFVQVFPPQNTNLNPGICSGDCFEVADTFLCDPGNYSFLLSDVHGCDSTVHVSLEVLPSVNSFVSANLCSTDSLFVGDTWYHPPGQYIEQQVSYNGCDSLIQLSLNAIICEITGNISAQPVVCHGDANGAIDFSVIDGTPPFTFTWKRLNGSPNSSGNLANVSTNVHLPNLPPGSYLITINDLFGNDVVLTTIVPEPPILSQIFHVSDYRGFQVACSGGQNGTLGTQPQGGTPGYQYLWSNGASTPNIAMLSAGVYTLTLTDAAGCSLVDQTSLQAPPPLNLYAQFINPNCDGYDTGIAQVSGANGGVPPYQFALENGSFSTQTSFHDLLEGAYTLRVQDANGCVTDTSTVLVAALIPTLSLGQDLTLPLGCSQRLQVFVTVQPQSIVWTPGYGLSCTNCLEPEAGPYHTSTYTLNVSSKDGCFAADSITIFIDPVRDVYVPNIFSPNDDGINDVFTIFTGKSVRQIKHLSIYSRWGELVFEQTNFSPNDLHVGWDGTFRGKALDSGVFVWQMEVEYLDEVVIQTQGDVSIVR